MLTLLLHVESFIHYQYREIMRNPSEANSSNGVFFIDLDEPKNYVALSAFSIFLLLFFPSDEGREFKLHSRLTISKATSWPFFFPTAWVSSSRDKNLHFLALAFVGQHLGRLVQAAFCSSFLRNVN